MKKFELIVLSVSILITTLISALFGLAGSSLTGGFWSWFWVSFLVQTILFIVVNSFLIQKDKTANNELTIQTFEQLSKISIKLVCSYCQQPNSVPVQLDQKNTFKCESCNQTNGVTMQFLATPITTPIDSVKIPIEGSEPVEFKVVR